jgi:hypothetical protein
MAYPDLSIASVHPAPFTIYPILRVVFVNDEGKKYPIEFVNNSDIKLILMLSDC